MTQVGPEINIFDYNCNSFEMVGDTYLLNTKFAGLQEERSFNNMSYDQPIRHNIRRGHNVYILHVICVPLNTGFQVLSFVITNCDFWQLQSQQCTLSVVY